MPTHGPIMTSKLLNYLKEEFGKRYFILRNLYKEIGKLSCYCQHLLVVEQVLLREAKESRRQGLFLVCFWL